MVEELSEQDIELISGGLDDGTLPIGIWDEWKWPWMRPPYDLGDGE